MFLDVSALTSNSFVLLTSCISSFSLARKLFLTGLNWIFLIIDTKSDSNSRSSAVAGGHLFVLKSYVYVLFSSNFPRNCIAFHIILFIKLPREIIILICIALLMVRWYFYFSNWFQIFPYWIVQPLKCSPNKKLCNVCL